MDDNSQLQRYEYAREHVATSSPYGVLWSLIGAAVIIIGLAAGLIASWTTFVRGANIVATILVYVAIVMIPCAIIGLCVVIAKDLKRKQQKKDLDLQLARQRIDALEAEERRKEEAHKVAMQLQIRTINFDHQGNAGIFDQYSREIVQLRGQMREHPNLTSYHNSPRVTGVTEEKNERQQLPPAKVQPPTFEEAMNQVARNSYEVCVGKSLRTGEYIKVALNNPNAHILLIGTTQKGKSTEAATIMDMLTQTHDRDRLWLSLLDLEDQTCNLFADLPHVLRLEVRNRTIKSIARSPMEVLQHLGYLRALMNARYELSPKERAKLPRVLIYLEEFLQLKRTLKGKDLAMLADDFTALAAQGLKANMHLMVCAQASYSQEEFREAMGQLTGIDLAFSARPSLAMAAGFMDYELLKQNFLAKIPGQFVIESSSGSDIGAAPTYDLQGKLRAMQNEEEETVSAHVDVREEKQYPHLVPLNSSAHPTSTPDAQEGAHLDKPAWEAYVDVIEKLQQEGHAQDPIIEKIWHAKKGSGNAKYITGRDIYRKCNEEIKRRRQERFDQANAL